MSPFDILRNKTLSGREARAVGVAVARATRAGEVRRLVAELARTVRSAERAMVARGVALEVVESPLGLPVPSQWVLPGEGCDISARMSRFVFLRLNRRVPLLLPAWSVDNMALTKTGVRAVNKFTHLRPFDVIRSELLTVLAARDTESRCNFIRIQKGATIADILRLFPGHRVAIERALQR